jgi:hypothetical protein
MKNIKILLFGLCLFTFTSGLSYADTKDKYTPSANGYPQVIQGHDYQTIIAIESLFVYLSKLGKDRNKFVAENGAITFKSITNELRTLVVHILDKKSVAFGGVAYKDTNTVMLFSTLSKILDNVSKNTKCNGVKHQQFPTRAYKIRTIIEFDCGKQVIVVDSFSNGPEDDERLYVLDIVERKKSFFWGKIE